MNLGLLDTLTKKCKKYFQDIVANLRGNNN